MTPGYTVLNSDVDDSFTGNCVHRVQGDKHTGPLSHHKRSRLHIKSQEILFHKPLQDAAAILELMFRWFKSLSL